MAKDTPLEESKTAPAGGVISDLAGLETSVKKLLKLLDTAADYVGDVVVRER
jgi:hypothetical protein